MARKGDLILVKTVHHDYVIGQGAAERTTFQFGVVASATRDGWVKKWTPVGLGDGLVSADSSGQWIGQDIRHATDWVTMPRSTIDVDGVLRAAKEHHWPGHPGQPMPFDSLEDAREVARPFLRELAKAGAR